MIVRVRFYSEYKEKYGNEEQLIEVKANPSIQNAFVELANKKPQLALDVEHILKCTIILVNGTIAPVETILNDNDLIAILPFITGG